MRKRVAWKVYRRVDKILEPWPVMIAATAWETIIRPWYKATTWAKAQDRMERWWRRKP